MHNYVACLGVRTITQSTHSHDTTSLSLSLSLSLSYLSEGFLHLQNLVGQAIIQWRAGMEGKQVEPIDVSVRVSYYLPPTTPQWY